ncbi:GFA family protein [Pseudomonas sp. NPDC089752]|uniref:GFA family protein n=1 Tax=Pseudomonas sp. NPDC089752 TaxID=3364472 RepID=UPI00380D61E7
MTNVLQGSCLCSCIKYELVVTPKAVTHCHCSQCRKGHGAAFATYGSVPREALRIVSGIDYLSAFASSASIRREFCSQCGSSLFWSRSQGEYAGWISIALGTLDTPFQPHEQKNAHLASAVPWLMLGAPGDA